MLLFRQLIMTVNEYNDPNLVFINISGNKREKKIFNNMIIFDLS